MSEDALSNETDYAADENAGADKECGPGARVNSRGGRLAWKIASACADLFNCLAGNHARLSC
jgi:hypothetical protein